MLLEKVFSKEMIEPIVFYLFVSATMVLSLFVLIWNLLCLYVLISKPRKMKYCRQYMLSLILASCVTAVTLLVLGFISFSGKSLAQNVFRYLHVSLNISIMSETLSVGFITVEKCRAIISPFTVPKKVLVNIKIIVTWFIASVCSLPLFTIRVSRFPQRTFDIKDSIPSASNYYEWYRLFYGIFLVSVGLLMPFLFMIRSTCKLVLVARKDPPHVLHQRHSFSSWRQQSGSSFRERLFGTYGNAQRNSITLTFTFTSWTFYFSSMFERNREVITYLDYMSTFGILFGNTFTSLILFSNLAKDFKRMFCLFGPIRDRVNRDFKSIYKREKKIVQARKMFAQNKNPAVLTGNDQSPTRLFPQNKSTESSQILGNIAKNIEDAESQKTKDFQVGVCETVGRNSEIGIVVINNIEYSVGKIQEVSCNVEKDDEVKKTKDTVESVKVEAQEV